MLHISSADIPTGSASTTKANILELIADHSQVVYVANTTARAQLVTDLTTAGKSVSASNPLYVHRGDAPTGTNLEVTTDGTTWRTVPSVGEFTAITLSANWAANDHAPEVRLDGSIVTLAPGRLQRGTTLTVTAGDNYQFGTVPAGFRPAAIELFAGVLHMGSTTPVLAEVRVDPDGSFLFKSAASGSFTSTSATNYLVIPSLSWPVA